MMRLRRALVTVTILAMTTAACGTDMFGSSGDGEPTTMTLTAAFTDVIDLVPQHSVRAGDVTVGFVDSIELVSNLGQEQAVVTFHGGASAHLDGVAWIYRVHLVLGMTISGLQGPLTGSYLAGPRRRSAAG